MTYGEIYSEICKIIYGSSTEPPTVDTRLHGSEGLIARKRKRLMEKENLWFMEKLREIYIAEGITEYDLTFGNFKEEDEDGLRFSSPISGDYQTPLKKLRDINSSFQDYDAESTYPYYYYIDWNTTSSYRRLVLKPKPQAFTDTVELSTGTTAEAFASTAFSYVIDGTEYDKAAVAAGSTFSAANTINSGAAASVLWGVWLIQINADGTISTKPGGGLSDQVYTSELNAINALPQVDNDNWPVGYVTVACNSGSAWTANTDDLTIGSDAYDVNYYNITTLLHMRYWGYLDDLSDTDATFDATEDALSINCADLIIWACVKELSKRDPEMLQTANTNITNEFNNIIDRNFQFKKANSGKIPYKRI